MRRIRAGPGAAARHQKSAVERDLSAALTSLIAGQGLQRHLVTRLGSSHDEMMKMEQLPANKAALLAVLGWAAREATSVAQALQQPQQQPPRPGPSAGASDEELLRLLQLVNATLAPLAVLAEVKLHNVELGRAVARTQLPQALARLLATLCPPGFRCCGAACGGGIGSRGSGSRGSAGVFSGAGIEARLDVAVDIVTLVASLWNVFEQVPELAACMTDSRLVESVSAALLRAQAAECGLEQQQRGGGAGAGPSTARAGGGGSGGSCYGAWLRGSKRAKQLWPVLDAMLYNVVAEAAPGLPPRKWLVAALQPRESLTLSHCRAALAGPAIQLLLGRVLVAETNRCLVEAQAAVEEAAGAGGSAAGSSRMGAAAAAGAAAPGLHQQRWHALSECFRSGTLPLPRNRSSAADFLMEVVEVAGVVWDFMVSGPRLPRLGQQPANVFFGGDPAAEAVRKVMGGVATPEEETAVAAAEAQLPPLHPPSYTAVQVYEMTHAALTAALAYAPAEAECLSAPSLLVRLVMELPPRQAAARLPGLWRTLSCALPRLACGADDGNAFQGPFWMRFGVSRSQCTRSLLYHLGLLLQLQLSPGPAAAAQPNTGSAGAASAAARAAGSPAAPSGAAAPDPGPDFSLRCALRGGLLPAIEALLRRLLGSTAAVALAGPQQAAGFMDAALQSAYTVDHLLRTSGVWPAVLAQGPPQQVASLVRTLGKALTVVGDTFHALRQRPQLLEPAMQLLSAVSGTDKGQRALFDVLSALLEQARCMTDQVLILQRRPLARATVGMAGGWHDRAHRLPVNDSLGPDGFTLRADWVASAGGRPSADTAAAHQQRVLADWAVLQWYPEITRQTDRDSPTYVYSAFARSLLMFMACRVLWPALRENLMASDAAAVELAAAIAPPADAAANAAGWRRFLLHDLDALGWTERVLARTAASTELKAGERGSWGLFGLTVLAVSQEGGGPEACDAAAGSTSVAAASVPLQTGAAAACNSGMRRQQQEQQRTLLQHVRRLSNSMGGEWPATVEGMQLSMLSEQAEESSGLRQIPIAVPELLLQQLMIELDNPYLLIYGGVPPAPDAEQVAALLGGAGLALCGNPACRSLEGDSEAGLMASSAPVGRQQGGGGGGGHIKTCSRCRAVRYCCGACQLQHWATGGHKEACAGAAGVSGSAGGGQSPGR